MKLVPSSHSALRERSREVKFDEYSKLKKQKTKLLKFMHDVNGVGLAANQIGDCRRYFVWEKGIVINPEIVAYSPETTTQQEGCLSFPGASVWVTRAKTIFVEHKDENDCVVQCTYRGPEARIFQHEVDHLNGICIV